MAIVLNNGVTNIKGTPGINSDIFANRPAATDVAPGSIYIATDTGVIYQSNGVSWSTIGGGGGPTPTPGIDDVLSVNQPLSTNQVIEMAGNTFSFQDGFFNAIQFFPDGDFVFGKNGNLIFNFQIIPGASQFYLQEPGGANHISLECGNRNYFLGDFLVQGNGNSIHILDTTDVIQFFNKGIKNGLYCDFQNKQFSFGRLNVGSEQTLEVDELNDYTYTTFNGVTNGLNLDFSATVFQFGALNSLVNPEIFLNINQTNANFYCEYSGNDNGLYLGFNPADRKYLLGDYQGIFNSTTFQIDDDAQTILLKNSQTAGSTTIEGNSLVFTGSNLESATSSGFSGQHLVITLNGVVYHIPLNNP